MYFPITLSLDAEENVLLVEQSLQQLSSSTTQQSFLEKLENNLEIITRAAQQQFAFRNASYIMGRYLGLPEDQQSITTQWNWLLYSTENITVQGSLPCLIKLVRYLEEYGQSIFPTLFITKTSKGSQAIDSAFQALTELLEKPVQAEGKASSIPLIPFCSDAPYISPPLSSRKRSLEEDPFDNSTSISILEAANILISIAEKSNPEPIPLSESTFSLLSQKDDNIIDSEDDEEFSSQSIPLLTAAAQASIEPFRIQSQEPAKKKRKTSHKVAYSDAEIQASLARQIKRYTELKKKLAYAQQYWIQEKNLFSSKEEIFQELQNPTSDLPLSQLTDAVSSIKKDKEDFVQASTSKKIPKRNKTGGQTSTLALFTIEKPSHSRMSIFHLCYIVKHHTYKSCNILSETRAHIAKTYNYIQQIISEESIVKWKEPLSTSDEEKKSQIQLLTSKQEILLKILQGVTANQKHLTSTHPTIFISTLKYDVAALLDKTIVLLTEALKKEGIHVPSSVDLLLKPISTKNTLMPCNLLQKMEKETQAVRVQKIHKLNPMKITSKHIFSYLFAIHKRGNEKASTYTLLYGINYAKTHFKLISQFQVAFMRTLSYIHNIQKIPLHQITYINPETHEKETIQTDKQLFLILFKGLRENQYYLEKYVPKFFKKTINELLRKNLKTHLDLLEKKCAFPEQTPSPANVIFNLMERENTGTCIPLYKARSSTVKDYLSIPYYFFSVTPVRRLDNLFVLSYIEKITPNKQRRYKESRIFLGYIIKIVNTILTTPNPQIRFYKFDDKANLQTSTFTDPSEFWPLIIQGLLETQAYHQEKSTTLFKTTVRFSPDTCIKEILNKIATKYPEIDIEGIKKSVSTDNFVRKTQKQNLMSSSRHLITSIPISVLVEPYFFTIKPAARNYNAFQIRYKGPKNKDQRTLRKHCRSLMINSARIAEKLLTTPPTFIYFKNPEKSENASEEIMKNPSQFWSIILRGLLENYLFYQQHCPKLLSESATRNPSKIISAAIEKILICYPNLKTTAPKQATIIPKLMGLNPYPPLTSHMEEELATENEDNE